VIAETILRMSRVNEFLRRVDSVSRPGRSAHPVEKGSSRRRVMMRDISTNRSIHVIHERSVSSQQKDSIQWLDKVVSKHLQ